MVIPLAGIIGGLGASRLAYAGFGARLFKSPIIQGGSFGVGYTGGSYLGYGASYRRPQQLNLGMSYGSYGRRRYGRSYGNRYSGYTRYSRRSYYRRRRPYYRRRSYY
ncbi:MAG TPA: hypothetical protein EYN67_08620 [Flavobacteriales bacterium]|nr:hypothetical protein [Flavobacteriales bacterium]